MTEVTLLDLKRLLESQAGRAEGVDWDSSATLGIPFEEIGYDSLALLDLTALVQREYGVRIPDDAVWEMTSPGAALDYINNRIREGQR
jgi:minimal PKS acyl carrier protein